MAANPNITPVFAGNPSWTVGVPLQRVALARQPSENIVRTLVTEGKIWRFRKGKVADVLARVRRAGEGIYVIGLDFHVAFLVHSNNEIQMCHSSAFEPVAVVCEDARDALAMESGYHVLGKLFDDALMRHWLDGTTISIRTK